MGGSYESRNVHSSAQQGMQELAVKIHDRRRRILTRCGLTVCLMLAGRFVIGGAPRRLVVNLSSSIPCGVYVATGGRPAIGKLAEFRLPEEFSSAFSNRNERVRQGMHILKPIAAAQGDWVDTSGGWLVINGERLAPIENLDSNGDALPIWRGNRRLRKGEYFVFSSHAWNSLDSRYFGPISEEQIIAVRKPLWTW